jgi:hypothetical protein
LVRREKKPFHLNGFAIFGMFTLKETADKVTDQAVDIRWNEAASRFLYAERLELSNV